jgi:flagellar basal-body rod modification protein FlgD
MASDITLTQAAHRAQQTATQRQTLAGDFDDFLNLLTVQLQHQDPLSPMDSTEFTNQLVSFAGVEQQINTNEKLNSLVNFGLTNINTQALGYVGLKANYQSNEAYYDGQEPVDITFAIEGAPVNATIRIMDDEGKTIKLIQGQAVAGRQDVVWDGTDQLDQKVQAGTYQVRIDSVNEQGNTLNAQILVSGVVRGVESQDGVPLLLIGERAVPMGNIINVAIPGSDPYAINNGGSSGTDETDETEDTADSSSEEDTTGDGETTDGDSA